MRSPPHAIAFEGARVLAAFANHWKSLENEEPNTFSGAPRLVHLIPPGGMVILMPRAVVPGTRLRANVYTTSMLGIGALTMVLV